MPPAHRDSDGRVCGATTVVQGQTTVFCNGLLWAVAGDPNDHGNGGLIPSGTTVFIEGKLVIVDAPDDAVTDDFLIPPHNQPLTAGGSGDVSAYG